MMIHFAMHSVMKLSQNQLKRKCKLQIAQKSLDGDFAESQNGGYGLSAYNGNVYHCNFFNGK